MMHESRSPRRPPVPYRLANWSWFVAGAFMVLCAGENILCEEVKPPIVLRQAATPVIAEIFYSVPARPLGELFPEALPGDGVIIRNTGKLSLFNGTNWQDTTPEQGFAALNRSTGSWLRWRGNKWEVIATSGTLNVRDYGANRVAEVHLLGTYMSARPWPHCDLPKGRCLYAVETMNVFQYVHHGLLEVPGIAESGKLSAGHGYLRNTLDLDQADIRVLLAPVEKTLRDQGRELVVPAIDATPIMDLPSGILNSQIDVRYPLDCERFPETAVYLGQTPFAAKVALSNSKIVATAAAVDLIPEELRSKAKSLVTYDYRSHVSREYGFKNPSPTR